MSSSASAAVAPADVAPAKVTPLFIGYALMLVQFILLGLFLAGLAFDVAASTITALGIAWGILLVLSLAAMTFQAVVNRRQEADGAFPSPHLLIPTESQHRVSQYMVLYRDEASAAPAEVEAERIAA